MSSVDERLREFDRWLVVTGYIDDPDWLANPYWIGRDETARIVATKLRAVFPELTQEDRPERRVGERRVISRSTGRRKRYRFAEKVFLANLTRRDDSLPNIGRRSGGDRRSPGPREGE